METQSPERGRRIELTDPVSVAIVEHYQRDVGDRTAGRTLTRIIQTFHAAGMRLTPEPPTQSSAA